MTRSLIVAVGENGVIGKDNGLPWKRIPADLRWFREKTMGHRLIMGRRTWESIGAKPLPGRESIVVTRQRDYVAPGAQVAGSLDQAWAIAGDDEVFILGGSDVFRATLPSVDRIYLTRVHATFEGDTFFPGFDEDEFHVVERIEMPSDEKNPYDLTFLVYERIGSEGSAR